MRILLVEDDLMVGNAMVDSLRDASYAADWVQNGNDAVTSCLTQHYDIVILDLGLPGQDGFSVLSALRRKGSSCAGNDCHRAGCPTRPFTWAG